ncbi:neuroblast differentiation-associated protein AHNAK isoform X1 [Neomonachus schauinslandi]|uniref:Neuroblast differentiation-associated protein AHNAK isoform X1 n=1 Tax=Neomonachus schauinslandi TaxID=29088 RepID=A0A8M1MR51_NEOSC|nr:neuroblast differentiation-associated protein AHNAK isoform X1 [Neomonachus schauinslandi]XP_044775659.1 neuroblast differentiation-associated protein AHNAK isoform X1 [Neomonachus schauinslandi]XP_044775660.1 neuroblast differentiation-associated protein AHNAK isoform X1 [Neomonachus schauinslandi]
MEKEEDTTRELLLPNWQGSGSHGLTIAQRDDGVFVQEVMQNSPAARTGVVREGDQIVGATIYFDNLQSGEVTQLLNTMGHHTVGLKLHRKGDRSPEPGQTWAHEVFSSRSSEVVLSGDDEDYQRIYTTKIKPRLRSEDGLEGDPGETQSRTITVTRRVTAYTVDVTGREGAREIDISSPEFKIKIPRHELTEISTVDVDTHSGQTVIRLPSGPGAVSPTTGSVADIRAGSVSASGPELQGAGHSKLQVTVPGIKVGSPGVNVSAKGLNLGGKRGVQVPGVDISSSLGGGAVEVQDPSLESGNNGKIKIPTMKVPKFSVSTAPEGQAPVAGLSISVPEFSVEHKGGKPGLTIGGNIQTPQLEVSAPSANIEGYQGKLKGPQITGPSLESNLGLKGAKPQGSIGVDISGPQIEGTLSGSNVEVQAPDIDIHGPGGKLNMPKVKVPKFSASGSKGGGAAIDVALPTGEVTLPGMSGDVSLPEVAAGGLEGQVKGTKVKTPETSIQKPKISMQDVDLSLGSPKLKGDIKVSVPGVQGDVKGPQVAVKGSKVDIETPSLEGTLTGPTLSSPSGKTGTCRISMTDVDLNVAAPKVKGGVDVTLPKVEGKAKVPEVDVKDPKVDVSAPGVEVHGPEWNLKMPKFSPPGVEGEGPDVDVKLPKDVSILGPKVNVEAPNVNIGGLGGKLKGPDIKLPEVSVKTPKISIPDVDLHVKGTKVKGEYDVTAPKLEGELKGPKVDLDAPDVDVQGPDWHLKMPKMKMPKISVPGLKAEGPEVDVNLPKADIDISGLKVDIDAPDVNIEGPDAKLKGPKFKMPEINIKAPKISMPDVDLDLKGSKVKGDFDVSVPKIEGTFKGPEVDLKGSGLDFEGLDARFSGPNLKMPSLDISAPKVTVPDVDLHFKAPKIGVSGPKLEGAELDLKGPKVDLEAPSLDVHTESPDINIEGPDIRIPKFRKPKFGFGAKSPKADFKSPSLDVTIPEAELNVETPEISVGGKGKKSKFKMPRIHMSGPKMKAKKQGFDLNVPGNEIDASLKPPDVDVNVAGPDATLKADVKSPKTKKPMFGKMYFPDVEFDIKSPKFKAEAPLPSPKLEGEIQAPDVDISSPGIHVEGPDIKLKAPKIKLPGMDVSGGKIEGDLKGPRVQANLDAPDINIEGPDAKVKAPSFGISGPQVSIPDVNVSLKGPKIKGDVPIVGLEGPDVDLQGPESKIKFPKFSMPKISVPGVKMEGVGAEVHAQLPSLGGGLSAPDVKLEGPDVSLKGPRVDLPSVNLSMPKASGPDLDLNLKGPSLKGDLDASVPGVKVHSPGLDLRGQGGKVRTEGDSVKVPGIDATLNLGTPDVTLKGPSLQGDLAVSGDIKCPKVSVGAPDLSLEAPEGGIKLPQMKLPQFGISTSGSDLDMNVKGPQVTGELQAPGIGVNLGGLNLKGPHISGPQISAPDMDLNLEGPKIKGSLGATGEMKGPTVGGGLPGISVQGLEGNVQMPGIKSSGYGVELPGVSVKLPTGQISGPAIKGDLKGSGIGFHGAAPDISVKGPSLNVASPESDFGVSLKGPKIKGGVDVSGGVSAPAVSLGEGNVSVKGPQASSTLNLDAPKFAGGLHFSGPKVEGGVKGGQVGLQGPGLSVSGSPGHLESRSGKVTFPKMKIPKFTFSGRELVGREVGVDINFPKAETTVQAGAGEGEWEESDVKLKKSKIKMPKFNFSKPKGKGGVTGSPEASISGSKGDLKSSKASLGSLEGDAEADTSSPKGKFSLFKSKKPRHRSNSFSDERELSAPSTPTGTLEFEGGEVSLEGGKVKGKHGKLKFGTFGGLGSKSKGHYEVTGSDDETGKLQGSGVSLASKKSRLSSSSSNDSGSKVGIQLPEVELVVSKKE